MRNKWVLVVLSVLILIQFIPMNSQTEALDPATDFIQLEGIPGDMARTIRESCYDCHSMQTQYPWYSYITPLKFWLKGHVDHGREELNFSRWNGYDSEAREHKLEEAAEMVLKESMPLKPYIFMHSNAGLNDQEREALAGYFESLASKYDQ